jgi:CHAD domain-containing protein
MTWHFEGPEAEYEEPFGDDFPFRSLPSDAEETPAVVRELAAGRLLFPLVRLKVYAQTVRLEGPAESRLSLRAERSVATPAWDEWPKGSWPLGLLTLGFLEGNPDALLHLATYLRDRLTLSPTHGDLCRAALQALGLAEPGAPLPTTLRIGLKDPLTLAARKVVGQQVLKMKANVKGTLEDLDPEYLHDLRVACRRLRSALRLFAAALGAKRSEMLRLELSWIARQLGSVRDLDVFILNLREQAQRLGEGGSVAEMLVDVLGRRRRPERAALDASLTSRRFRALLHRLEALAASPPPRIVRGVPGGTVAEAAPALITRAQKRVLKLGRAITPDSPAADLHRLRILFKRLRYACEFFREAFADLTAGQDPLADYIEGMVRFQDCLGEHQDAVVAIGRIQELASDMIRGGALSPDQLLNLGSLIQVQREITKDRRDRLLALWGQFDKRSVRRRLTALEVGPSATLGAATTCAMTGSSDNG